MLQQKLHKHFSFGIYTAFSKANLFY